MWYGSVCFVEMETTSGNGWMELTWKVQDFGKEVSPIIMMDKKIVWRLLRADGMMHLVLEDFHGLVSIKVLWASISVCLSVDVFKALLLNIYEIIDSLLITVTFCCVSAVISWNLKKIYPYFRVYFSHFFYKMKTT